MGKESSKAKSKREPVSFKYYGESFEQILDFYLFKTPCPETSKMGQSFEELGWHGGKFKSLQAAMRKTSGLSDRWICDKADNLDSRLKALKISEKNPCEYAVYCKRGSVKNNTKMKALFYGIRCALAHGSFATFERRGTRWYRFENRQGNKPRGYFQLKESTLITWIGLVSSGPNRISR